MDFDKNPKDKPLLHICNSGLRTLDFDKNPKEGECEYRRGYEDGKNNREYDFDRKHENERWEEERKKYECELF